MLLAFIILNILGIAAFLLVLASSTDDNDEAVLLISCVCFIIGFICYVSDDTPTAMDVYKGKTTLEITYKDGIPIDSVVVFKDKEK